MLNRKIVSVFLVMLLLASSGLGLIPAFAAEESAWIELLETGTVGNTGQNWFSYSTSAMVSVPTPRNMRCTKVDMLIAYTAGTVPSKVQLQYNGTLYNLTIAQIDNSTARVYGDIPDTYYSDLVLVFTRNSTSKSYLEILSCRVTPVSLQAYSLGGQVYIGGAYYSLAQHVPFGQQFDTHTFGTYLAYAITYDWAKYDTVTFYGSITDASIESVRVSLGSQILPAEVNFLDVENGGSWQLWNGTNTPDGLHYTGDSYDVAQWGQYVYSVTVDVSNVDRTVASTMLQVCFTGQYDDMYGGTINCQSISGTITVPDTSGATWWHKITTFLSGLFNPDSSEAEDFQSSADQQGQQMDDLNEQLDSVTKPPVSDVVTDVADYVDPNALVVVNGNLAQLTNNPLIVAMLMISLTIVLLSYILFGKR